jgi:hypothetical protein
MRDNELKQLKQHIASRWPTSGDFYAERDDRTVRLVGPMAEYATRPVEIHVDPSTASELTVQRIALTAATLTVRWARRVRVLVPEGVPLHQALQRGGHATLAERVDWEMHMADPFFDSSPATADQFSLRLFVGAWSAGVPGAREDDYQVFAIAWTALGARLDNDALRTVIAGDATAPAAALAGALGAADLFKRAVGHAPPDWLPTFALDTWSAELALGNGAWDAQVIRSVPQSFDVGRLLLAGVGAIGSAILYVLDMMVPTGHVTLLDCDSVDITNLNRSPLFSVLDAYRATPKTTVAERWISNSQGLSVRAIDGVWRDYAENLGLAGFDAWISLTNEDGAWANVPFQLPPVVLHGTTTSGWGFGAGRHIPRVEDCTMCRMPRPEAEFRGPCAQGALLPTAQMHGSPRQVASLPFLSTASAALVLSLLLQLEYGREALQLPNSLSADLSAGLPALIALHRGPTAGCRGCQIVFSSEWNRRGGRGRFAALTSSR